MLRACLTFAAAIGLGAVASAAPPAPPVPTASPASSASPDPKSLEVPQEELSKARELVQKLGSEAYAEREESQRELAEMGRLARQALLDGASTNPDPEVRLRCQVLLPKATAAEMKARLDSFLADAEGKYDHDLPGWHKLRSVVRGEWKMLGWTFTTHPNADKAARELFVEFLKAPGGTKLLTALGGPPGEFGQLVALRKTELYNAKYGRIPGGIRRNPSAEEVAVVVFAESQVPARNVPRATALTTVLTTSGLPALVQESTDRGQALRAVMTAWFDSRTEPVDMYSALTLANSMQNNQAAGRLAGRLMSVPGATGYYRGLALTTLVRLKMTDQLPNIEKAFADQTALSTTIRIVNGMQVRQTIEVRDAALAAALLLTGQDPQDYGFDAFPKNTNGTFSYSYARLPDEKRKGAFEKWKEWREKNP